MKSKIFFLALFFASAGPVLADDCASIHYSICYGIDTIAGGRFYETEVIDCKNFQLRRYDTDYLCKETGKLVSTENNAIDGVWRESNRKTTRKRDEMEYGSYFFKDRYLWNADKTRLLYEAVKSKDVMARELLDSSNKFYPRQEEGTVNRSYSKEGNEIVERNQAYSRWKTRHTRGEWLEKMNKDITAYPAD